MGLANRATWRAERALVFARGLYHVAACDGVHPAERRALELFLEQVGLPMSVDDLGRTPFDYVEAGRVLDSSWLRRTFIQACRMVVMLDGAVSPQERDTLRALGSALGVGERFALADFEGPPPPPEHLRDWVASQEVDFVSWDDDVQRGYFWPFPHPDHPLRHEGTLVVEQGQALVVRVDGQITDVLVAGEHRVTPRSLPGLARALGWMGGPVSASLLFVKVGPTPLLRWGTSDAIHVPVPGQGAVEIRAFGRFSVRLVDPSVLVERFARTEPPAAAEVEARVRRMFEGRFGEGLSQLPFSDVEHLIASLNDLDALRDALAGHLNETLGRAGLALRKFQIENLTGPLELGLRPASKRTHSLTELGRALNLTSTSLPEVPSTQGEPMLGPCIDCLAPTPLAARFCATCGAAQRRSCPGCGTELPLRARFCSGCGHRLVSD